jgi:hypothetical protein
LVSQVLDVEEHDVVANERERHDERDDAASVVFDGSMQLLTHVGVGSLPALVAPRVLWTAPPSGLESGVAFKQSSLSGGT